MKALTLRSSCVAPGDGRYSRKHDKSFWWGVDVSMAVVSSSLLRGGVDGGWVGR